MKALNPLDERGRAAVLRWVSNQYPTEVEGAAKLSNEMLTKLYADILPSGEAFGTLIQVYDAINEGQHVSAKAKSILAFFQRVQHLHSTYPPAPDNMRSFLSDSFVYDRVYESGYSSCPLSIETYLAVQLQSTSKLSDFYSVYSFITSALVYDDPDDEFTRRLKKLIQSFLSYSALLDSPTP